MHFSPDEPTQQPEEPTEQILPDFPDNVVSLDAHRKDVLVDPLLEALFNCGPKWTDEAYDDGHLGPDERNSWSAE